VLADGVLDLALYVFDEVWGAEVGSAVGLEVNGFFVASPAFHLG